MNQGSIGSTKWLNYLADKLKAILGITSWQKKTMVTVDTPSEMDFFNLEANKTYRLTVFLSVQNVNSEDVLVNIKLDDGSEVIPTGVGLAQNSADSLTIVTRYGASTVFTPTINTGVSFTFAPTPTGILQVGSFAVLEELPNHVETTKFN